MGQLNATTEAGLLASHLVLFKSAALSYENDGLYAQDDVAWPGASQLNSIHLPRYLRIPAHLFLVGPLDLSLRGVHGHVKEVIVGRVRHHRSLNWLSYRSNEPADRLMTTMETRNEAEDP